jgi:outer membrane protein
MRSIRIVLVLFFYLVIRNAEAQKAENWTLSQCISYAVANNLDIKSNQIENSINKENLNQSKRDLLPYVSMSSSGYNYFGKSLDYDSYEYVDTKQTYLDFDLYGGIDLFKGFTKQNTISYKKITYLAGLKDEEQQKYDLAFTVMQAYYNAVYYHGLIDIVKEQKDLSELNLKQTRKQVDLGLKAKADLLEMESRLAKEELTLIQTENSYKTALLDLKQAMNFISNEELIIDFSEQEPDVLAIETTTPVDIYNSALNFYPTIKSKELQKDAAKKNVTINKGNLWPRLTMSGGYSTYYSHLKGNDSETFHNQFKNNASQYVGLNLSIPLFQKLAYRSEVKLAKLNLLQSEVTYNKAKLDLFNEISQDYQELQSYYSEYNQLVKQEDYSDVAFQAAEKKFNQGLISIIEMYDSKSVLAQAKSDLLRTKLLYVIKKKTIDYYMGKPVFDF